MAVSPREDGGADDRREARHGRIDRCRVPEDDPRPEHLSGPVGHPDEAVNPLARHYSLFRVAERLLLTGHSHQAWPDVAREGVVEAWDDAALHVDEKWERAFEKAERVREGFRVWLDEADAEIALDQNTFGLVLRFLSALELERRARLVTTDGEFHTLRRLLARLREEQLLDVVVVAARPAETLAERLADKTDE